MREIEIKCRVLEKDGLISILKSMNISLSDPVKQHDVVFGKPGSEDNALGVSWLRIRTEDDKKVFFTLKQSVVGHLDSVEHETVVEDSFELENIIKMLGFELHSDLTKIRRKAKVGDIEICLDEVPGLGTFIEAEKIMEKEADHDSVVADLWNLLSSFGLEKSEEVHEGYDVLERKKRGL